MYATNINSTISPFKIFFFLIFITEYSRNIRICHYFKKFDWAFLFLFLGAIVTFYEHYYRSFFFQKRVIVAYEHHYRPLYLKINKINKKGHKSFFIYFYLFIFFALIHFFFLLFNYQRFYQLS